MKSKKIIFIFFLICICYVSISCKGYSGNYDEKAKAIEEVDKGERDSIYAEQVLLDFILTKLASETGGVRTNYLKEKTLEYGVKSEEVLAESVGLMMEYALISEREDIFKTQFNYLKQNLLKEDGKIYWVFNEEQNEGKKSSAPIDDLRISASLYKGFEKWYNKEYFEVAKLISNNILENQIKDGYLIQSITWNPLHKSSKVKLSYLDTEMFQVLAKYDKGFEEYINKNIKLLNKGRYENIPFYHKVYNLKTNKFISAKEINLIDTLLTSLNLQKANNDQTQTLNWLKTEFSNQEKIYGRYNSQNGNNSVNFESVAVYSLIAQLSLELGDEDFTRLILQRMLKFQDLREGSDSFGGFVDTFTNDGHSFDNIEALLILASFNKHLGGSQIE